MQNQEYSNTDILNLFYIHGECHKFVQRTCRLFNERYPNLPAMTREKFNRMESNFLEFGTVKSISVRPKPITNDENNEIDVLAYFNAHPRQSIRSAAQDLGITFYAVQAILKKHKMHDYSFTTVQELHPGDSVRRLEFCEQILIKTQEDPLFLRKIIWTDEAKFSREGIINRRNLHHWATENPHLKRNVHFQNRFSFNVFCLLMNNRYSFIIYDYNLTGERYVEILRGVVSTFLENLPLNILRDSWYQMDGAPAHSTREVHRELTQIFEDRWIGCNGPCRWPPRSPDLTPLDFFLWGYIKSEVYNTPVRTRQELEDRVRTAFRQLNPDHIHKACTKELFSRIHRCLQENGGHIQHL
jgi:hypothetical protein